MEIATSNYASYTLADGKGFATTVGKPRPNHQWGGLPAMNAFAPYGIFNAKPRLSQVAFTAKYVERLEAKAPELMEFLEREWEDGHERIVLLCWCHVKSTDYLSPHGYCHRLIAGHWLSVRLGIEVPELSLRGKTPAFVTEPLFRE